MNVLSLYNGISCGRVGFERANIPVEKYISYEIDEYANKVAKDNYPDDEYLGDVFEADFKQYEGNIDIVIGGSPCTYWSIAQKYNRETEASGLGWELFSQYVRAIKETKPKYFLYENNYSMSKDIRASIDKEFGFEAIMINSALVSAQNRKRLYWVGKRNDDGTYSKVNIQQPEDKGILLKDILESGQRNIVAKPINVTDLGKSQTIKAQYYKNSIANFCCYTSTYGATGVAEPIRISALSGPNGELSTSNGGGMGVKTGKETKYQIYEVKGGQITIRDKQYPIKLQDGFYIIRKLTVNECCRLQTLPDDYCKVVSNTQAYKGIGNGWTVDVIAHIFKGLRELI